MSSSPNAHTVGVGATLLGDTLPPLGRAFASSGVAACPMVGAGMTFQDGQNTLEIPFGLGFGAIVELGDGLAVAPYVVPQWVWWRYSDNGSSFSDSDVGVRGGANLIVRNLYFGGTVVKHGDSDAVFGVTAGLVH